MTVPQIEKEVTKTQIATNARVSLKLNKGGSFYGRGEERRPSDRLNLAARMADCV